MMRFAPNEPRRCGRELATVLVRPEEARGVLGGHMHEWLKEYHLPTRGAPFWLTLAEQGGVIVGAHAFEIFGSRSRGYDLQSFSTYALKRARGCGLGAQLWAHSLAFTQVSHVDVTIATSDGSALIERVKDKHPNVRFRITQTWI